MKPAINKGQDNITKYINLFDLPNDALMMLRKANIDSINKNGFEKTSFIG